MKYRHDLEPLPINDQHRSRGHPYWPLYPHKWNIRVNLQLQWAIPVASRYVTNTRGETYCIPVDEQFVHHASYLVTGFVLFSRFRVPASLRSNHTVSGQTMMDTVTPRGPENISLMLEEQSQSWAIKLLDTLFHEPVSHRNSHAFMDDVEQTPKFMKQIWRNSILSWSKELCKH